MQDLNYTTVAEVRMDSGLTNAKNLTDAVVRQQIDLAQKEIDGALSSKFTVPFNPVPDQVKALALTLSSALLQYKQYKDVIRKKQLDDARAEVEAYATGAQQLLGPDGIPLADVKQIGSYPGDDAPRAFSTRMRF